MSPVPSTLVSVSILTLILAASSVCAQAPDPIEPREEWFRGLDIEAAVADAELILVSRIDEVKEIPMPVGGKGEHIIHQLQFKPVRVLKGVFARDRLTLTSYDQLLERIEALLRERKVRLAA